MSYTTCFIKECSLKEFCNRCCEEDEREIDIEDNMVIDVFKTPQSVRNCVNRLAIAGVIEKVGKRAKHVKIKLAKKYSVTTEGNVLYELKLFKKDESNNIQ